MGFFRPKYMFELKIYRGESCVIILKIDVNFEEKTTCGLKDDMRNFVNFTGALKILIFVL